jgi:hypothetical protein
MLLQDVESELGMTREKLIRIAMLLGSDYTEGIRSGLSSMMTFLVVYRCNCWRRLFSCETRLDSCSCLLAIVHKESMRLTKGKLAVKRGGLVLIICLSSRFRASEETNSEPRKLSMSYFKDKGIVN